MVIKGTLHKIKTPFLWKEMALLNVWWMGDCILVQDKEKITYLSLMFKCFINAMDGADAMVEGWASLLICLGVITLPQAVP